MIRCKRSTLFLCVYTHSRRDHCFKGEADYGYCAAKDLHYYGFKLGLRVARSGMIIEYPLLPARPHDIQCVEDLTTGFVVMRPPIKASLMCGDKPFWPSIVGWSL